MKKSNWKTSALGALTIIIALATGTKEFLATNSLPDIGLIFSSVLAGWGLIAAKDADSRI